jgi:hypothetical protein
MSCKHPISITTVSCILILVTIFVGCTSVPLPNTNTTLNPTLTQSQTTLLPTTPQPQIHIISPYILDNDGYYIADVETYWTYNDKGQSKHFSPLVIPSNKTYYNQLGGKDLFNITHITNHITSGESLVFEGTSTLPPNTIIPIYITDPVSFTRRNNPSYQYFSAPILPGINGTNTVKVKIPAFNIHIDGKYHPNRTFPHCEIYENTGFFGMSPPDDGYFNFTITSDTNYPMIWEDTTPDETYPNHPHIWVWTNDTTTEHRYGLNPFFAYNVVQPYPTYKPPQKW